MRTLLREMLVRVSSEIELCRLYVVLQSEAIDSTHPAHAFLVNRDAITIALLRALVAPFVTRPEATARQLVALMDGLLQH